MGKSEKVGLTCLIAFLTPFCLVGLFTLVMAGHELMNGEWETGGFLGLFGVVFGGVGFGFLAIMIRGRARMQKELALKLANPTQPWKWRGDWSEGIARGEAKHTMFFAWGFSVLWNLISLPLLYFLPSEILEKENYPALLGLLFPLVGVGLLVWAVRETIEWKKFGQSVFRMNSTPGVIGGELSGVIDVQAGFDPGQDFDLTLTSVNRVRTGSGKNSSTTETILWQDKQSGVKSLARPEAMGCGVAVQFSIPFESQETNSADPNNLILWSLEAHAAVPGVDYHAQFEVPVFKTSASKSTETEKRVDLPSGYQPSPESGITVGVGPTGGRELIVRPKRAMGAILSILVFLMIWTGVVFLIAYLGAPLMFVLVFGAFDLLFLFLLLQLSFGESRILLEANAVSITNSIAFFSTTVTIPASEIQSVKPSIGMQSGRSVSYLVLLTRQGRKESRIWVTLKEKHDAEWLAEEIRRHIASRHL